MTYEYFTTKYFAFSSDSRSLEIMKFLAQNSENAKVIPDKLFKSSKMQNQLSRYCLALIVLGAKINFIALQIMMFYVCWNG